MTGSRDMILAAVRANAPSAAPLPVIPAFPLPAVSLLERFRASFALMGGTFLDWQPGTDLNAVIASRFPDARVICSPLPGIRATRPLPAPTVPHALEDVDVAIVRAAFGVAETGSIFLSEAELVVNALGYLPEHLAALLDPGDIVPNLHDAYRDPRFLTARYAVLMTGPSATADIEGVLIRGAQGIRSLTVVPVPRD